MNAFLRKSGAYCNLAAVRIEERDETTGKTEKRWDLQVVSWFIDSSGRTQYNVWQEYVKGGSANEAIVQGWTYTYERAYLVTVALLDKAENKIRELEADKELLEAELETLKLDQSRFLGA